MSTPAEKPRSDVLIHAGWLVTVDAHDTVIDDGAVAVVGGHVADLGTFTALRERHPQLEVVELPGHALMPGLVNAHTHLAMTMFRGLADDMDLEQFLSRMLPAEMTVLTAERVRAATLAASMESVAGGVTSALDMYFHHDASIDAASQVGLRLQTGPVFFDSQITDSTSRADVLDEASDWLDAHPPTTGLRHALSPHSTYTVSPDYLTGIAERARGHRATLHIHAAETAAEIQMVSESTGRRPVELLASLGLLGPDTVLAHGVHLDDSEIDQVVSSNASIVHCPASNMKLASGFARVPDLLGAGVNVALGSDGAASSNDLDMFAAMRLAALLHKGRAEDATVVPAAAVLRMATINGARALGAEDLIGSIEPGKAADLVAVSLSGVHTQPVYDPISAIVYAAGRGDVTDVWIDGVRRVDDRRLVGLDPVQAAAELGALRSVVLDALER